MVDLAELAEEAHRTRRALLLGAAGAAFVSAAVLVTALGLALGAGFVAPSLAARLPSQVVGASVGGVGLSAASPWFALMLAGSAWYHRRLSAAVAEAGLGRVAHGFRAAWRALWAPALGTAALLAAAAALVALWPEPSSEAAREIVPAILVLASPLLAPVIGLLWARHRVSDPARAREIQRIGLVEALERGLLDGGPGAFPLIGGRPLPVVRAEALRLAGRPIESEALLRGHLRDTGLGPVSALLTLARALADAGRLDRAEAVAAAATRIFLPGTAAWRLLAEIQVARGMPDRADEAIAHARAIRVAFLPLAEPAGGAGRAPVG
jgi:hypothetical protein